MEQMNLMFQATKMFQALTGVAPLPETIKLVKRNTVSGDDASMLSFFLSAMPVRQ